MWKQKGQGIVEYALILAFVVGVGGVLYSNTSGSLVNSIRSVFSSVNTTINPATSAQDIIERLRQGRYDGLAKDELKWDKNKTLIITSDSQEGQALANKLNIHAKQGDAWFARVLTNGVTVLTYYSADANGGMTYDALKKDYDANPSKYYTKDTGNHETVRISEGYYNSSGGKADSHGTYFENVRGYVGPSPSGKGIIIDPTQTNKL